MPRLVENSRNWPHWTTPEWYLDAVESLAGDEHISLDPCANGFSLDSVNAKVSLTGRARFERRRGEWFYESGEASPGCVDGLLEPWHEHVGLVFVNPAYGRVLPLWTRKIVEEAAKGCEIIALLPARVDTRWMHDDVFKTADGICLHRGRIKFGNPPPTGSSSPTFPSLTAYWGARYEYFEEAFEDLGRLWCP